MMTGAVAITSSLARLLAVQPGPGPKAHDTGLGVPLEIAAATALACGLLTATVLLLSRVQRRRDKLVVREQQARAQMEELCPTGWTARVTLYGRDAPLPDDAPTSGEQLVCVEWTEFEPNSAGRNEAAVSRRMWSRTIAGALRGMVADRRLDYELEQIERIAAEEGDPGPPAG
jgi:hypothetical protein